MQYWKLRSAANLSGDEEELPLMSTACKWFVCVYRTRGWPCLAPRQRCRHRSVAEAGNSRWKWAREGRADPAAALHALYSLSAGCLSFISIFTSSPPLFHFKHCLSLFFSESVLDVCSYFCPALFLVCWQVHWYLRLSPGKHANMAALHLCNKGGRTPFPNISRTLRFNMS